MTELIYFDNAASSLPKPPEVARAVSDSICTFGGAGRGGHPAALAAAREIFRARTAVASLLGSAPERTVFTSNATESLNIAINGLINPGDHVITTVLEHNSVLRPLYSLRSHGAELSFIGTDESGNLKLEELPALVKGSTKAVVCTHASNLTGAVTDLQLVSRFCREHGLLFIVDASQTAGVFPIDADDLGIDALCFTGHKSLFGPQGTGGLCVGKNTLIPPLKVGGSGMSSFSETHPPELPESLEAGTPNAHGIAGLAAGVNFILREGIDNIRKHELKLTALFRESVARIPRVRIYGDPSRAHAPIVSLNIAGIDAADVGVLLSERYNICVRTGAHCAPLAHIALGTREQGSVRFSFSHFNTPEEIHRGITALAEIASERRE